MTQGVVPDGLAAAAYLGGGISGARAHLVLPAPPEGGQPLQAAAGVDIAGVQVASSAAFTAVLGSG